MGWSEREFGDVHASQFCQVTTPALPFRCHEPRRDAGEFASVAMRNRSANWSKMAQQARAIADSLHDPAAKQAMLEIAERYDLLAAYAERQAQAARPQGDVQG
jgi:hypothetical protein